MDRASPKEKTIKKEDRFKEEKTSEKEKTRACYETAGEKRDRQASSRPVQKASSI